MELLIITIIHEAFTDCPNLCPGLYMRSHLILKTALRGGGICSHFADEVTLA